MKKFLVLYMAPSEEMAKLMQESSPEAMKKSMDEWKEWAKSHREIVDLGGPVGKNLRVKRDAVSKIGNDVGGYSLVEAESQEAAAEVIKGSPHFGLPGFYVDVMEVVEM